MYSSVCVENFDKFSFGVEIMTIGVFELPV